MILDTLRHQPSLVSLLQVYFPRVACNSRKENGTFILLIQGKWNILQSNRSHWNRSVFCHPYVYCFGKQSFTFGKGKNQVKHNWILIPFGMWECYDGKRNTKKVISAASTLCILPACSGIRFIKETTGGWQVIHIFHKSKMHLLFEDTFQKQSIGRSSCLAAASMLNQEDNQNVMTKKLDKEKWEERGSLKNL